MSYHLLVKFNFPDIAIKRPNAAWLLLDWFLFNVIVILVHEHEFMNIKPPN